MPLVVDASVALKWVLHEADSHFADALLRIEPDLLVPDFWLGEATNVLWLQVRRKLLTSDEAREGLALLRTQVPPIPTADMDLHEVALEIGMAVNHSTYDTLYMAVAIATGARGVVVADGPCVRAMRTHPDPALAAMLIPLDAWVKSKGIDSYRKSNGLPPEDVGRIGCCRTPSVCTSARFSRACRPAVLRFADGSLFDHRLGKLRLNLRNAPDRFGIDLVGFGQRLPDRGYCGEL